MRLLAIAIYLAFLFACADDTSQTTSVSFDPLLAMQECHLNQGVRAQHGDQKREIEDRVLSQTLAPENCGEYAEMLETIAETEAMPSA